MWWSIIKDDRFNRFLLKAIERVYEKLSKITSHPDFNLEAFNERANDYAKTTFKQFDETSNEAEFTEKMVSIYGESRFTNTQLVAAINDIFQEHRLLTGNRSMLVLQGMASDLNIDIEIDTKNYPRQPYTVNFSYGGLDYKMHDGGLNIYVDNAKIWVCIGDTAKLPIGDFYASMLGLLKNDPARIPTLEFGIKLADILKTHMSSIKTYYPNSLFLEIHTPFMADEPVNEEFQFFIQKLKRNMRKDILDEIKQALKETVGNDGGFF